MYSDDTIADFHRCKKERYRRCVKRPRCSYCDKHIQDERAFYIEGEWMCESCMNDNYLRDVIEE